MFSTSCLRKTLLGFCFGWVALAGTGAVSGIEAAGAAATADPLAPLVSEALRANLSLQGERLAERRSAAEERQALALWLPRVELSARGSQVNGVANLGDLVNPAYEALNRITGTSAFPARLDLPLVANYETRLRAAQPLFNEEIRANLSAARALHDAQSGQLETAGRQIAAAAQIAYLQEASSRRVVEVNEAALGLARENERVAERLLAAGSATPEAVQRARADRAAIEQELAEASEQHLAAARGLNQILARPLDAPIEAIPDSAFDLPVQMDADSAVARALTHREEIAQMEANLRAAGALKRAATSRYLPSLSFAFDYGFQGSRLEFRKDQDSWTASLLLQVDLVDFGREAARGAAESEVDRVQVALRDLQNQIRLEVETAHEAAVTARGAIATAQTRFEAARRTFDLVRRRYEEGTASSLELIDARTGLTAAELNRVLTLYRYAMRRVDLERAAALRDLS